MADQASDARDTIGLMRELGISFISFGIATLFLWCAHRIMLWRGRRTLGIFAVYPIGAFILWSAMPAPATALVLYALLSLLSFIWLITPVLGDTAPTSRIIAFLRARPGALFRSIADLFDNKDMVEKRLHDLVLAGLVERTHDVYRPTLPGKLVAWAVLRYLHLISWEVNGTRV